MPLLVGGEGYSCFVRRHVAMQLFSKVSRQLLWLLVLVAIVTLGVGYALWSPGAVVRDGRHDLRTNGIWLQHGWLGDDKWFERYSKDLGKFRDRDQVRALASLLRGHGIEYVFPHACPCSSGGDVSPVDATQTELFLDEFSEFSVIPWVGGVLGVQAFPDSASWRRKFVTSTVSMLVAYPRLAGIHVNIEPMPSGSEDFLVLLDWLREEMPPGKILSVAAFPPPTAWQPSPEVHWDEHYYREVASRTDQVVPMMYNTAHRSTKAYRALLESWTSEVLLWSGDTQVLLGVPAYDDADTGYHDPEVENLEHSLSGIHASLNGYDSLPKHYGGVAIYCGWEMEDAEWRYFQREFERSASPQ